MRQVDISTIAFQVSGTDNKDKLWKKVEKRWMDQLNAKIPNRRSLTKGGYQFTVNIHTAETELPTRLELETDESYVLNIDANEPVNA